MKRNEIIKKNKTTFRRTAMAAMAMAAMLTTTGCSDRPKEDAAFSAVKKMLTLDQRGMDYLKRKDQPLDLEGMKMEVVDEKPIGETQYRYTISYNTEADVYNMKSFTLIPIKKACADVWDTTNGICAGRAEVIFVKTGDEWVAQKPKVIKN